MLLAMSLVIEVIGMTFLAAGIEWIEALVFAHVQFKFMAVDAGMAFVVVAEFVTAHAVDLVFAAAYFHPHGVVTAAPYI